MLQLTLMQNIAKYLARFSEEVKLLNDIGDFSINVHAENMLVTLLNKVYGLQLVNLNPTAGNNVAAIDLLDKTPGREIAFQVTATSSIEKVKDCIRKYFKNEVYRHTGRLKIFIITSRQGSYSQAVIDKVVREAAAGAAGPGLSFTADADIIDRKDLYNHLYAENDLEKIKEVEQYLRQQFGLSEEKDRLAAYYERLKSMFYETVMDDEKGLTLDQIYIEPSFAVIHSALKKGDPRLNEKKHKKFYEADPRYKVQEFIEDMFSGGNPLELNVMPGLVLILGYPGQGKSSFCKKLMNSYILSGKTGQKPLFYFQLRNIRQAKEFIFNPLTILYDEACVDAEQILDRFQFNKSFLILDGLDELYLRENLKTEDIDRLCVELVRLLEKHQDLNIVLTSRYGYIDDGKLAKERINIIQMMSLSAGMQMEWLATYRRFHPETWLTEEILASFHKKAEYFHIKELTEQPLLLHMIASVKNEINESTTRSMVYQQLFSELIDRKYAREGQIELLKGVTKDDLRNLIREVSFAIYKTGNEYITRAELLKLEAALSFLKLLPEENFRDSIKGVMISFYFKETGKLKNDPFDEDKSNYAIEFLHKSLREYMTAEKIFFTLKEKFLERKMNGRYVIDDARSALEVINEIFGVQPLSREIVGHIKEIAQNATDVDPVELVDRMLLFLPAYLDCDFIIEYRMDQGESPIDLSLRCFYGLWQFISTLGLQKNYLHTDDSKRSFASYLRLVGSFDGLDLSHQQLAGQIIELNLYLCTLKNVDFSNCQFFRSTFVRCNMQGVNFNGCQLGNVEMYETDLYHCTFRTAVISALDMTECYLVHCDFTQSNIYKFEGESNFEDCDFSQANIDPGALKRLKRLYPSINKQLFNEPGPPGYTAANLRKPSQRKDPPENYKRLLLDQ